MGAGHAALSPSGAPRWMRCVAAPAMEKDIPEEDKPYADEGTAAHELAAMALNEGKAAEAYLGRIITVNKGGEFEKDFEVDDAMAGFVQTYIDNLQAYVQGGTLLVEHRMPIEELTGEKDAAGTSDAVIITRDADELQVHDLKYGRWVIVSAEKNEQLMMYALAALAQFSVLGEFKRVRMVIHQPRTSESPVEWDCTVAELLDFGHRVKFYAKTALALYQGKEGDPKDFLNPGDKQCRFCNAAGTCPGYAAEAQGIVFTDLRTAELTGEKPTAAPVPSDVSLLGTYRDRIEFIEHWCSAVKARVDALLFAGEEVPGWKPARGKRPDRDWADEATAAETMKAMRLKHDEMYTYSLISPTQAEKLLKKESPKRWNKLQKLQVPEEDRIGKLIAVPETDPRPRWVPEEAKFTDLRGVA